MQLILYGPKLHFGDGIFIMPSPATLYTVSVI